MSKSAKYLMMVYCYTVEGHEGEKWINDEELHDLKEKSEQGNIPNSCSNCQITVKDEQGDVVYETRGC